MKPVFTILLVSLAWTCASADDDEPDYYDFGNNYVKTPLGEAIDKATLKILKETYEGGQDKNVITSPLGVLLLLSLYSTGAGPNARQEISSLLGGGDHKQLSESYSSLSNTFADMDPSYLTLANKVYVGNQNELADQFENTARTYRSEVDKLDFTKPEEAAKIINNWSENKTQGHIKEPVSPDTLSPDTVAALFNVIFFKGHWHVPFDAKDTTDKDFHVDKVTTVKKPTMKLVQSLYYTFSTELGAQIVELPYKEKGFRMIVVLPNEIDGLPSVLEKASQKGLLDDIFNLTAAGRDVELEIPKFEINSKLDFNEILPKVGVSQIFSEAATGLLKNVPVQVSKVFQEAFVKVDEEGATAGAFTGLQLVPPSLDIGPPPPPQKFIVDHPFLFLILHQDKPLFAGTYSK